MLPSFLSRVCLKLRIFGSSVEEILTRDMKRQGGNVKPFSDALKETERLICQVQFLIKIRTEASKLYEHLDSFLECE